MAAKTPRAISRAALGLLNCLRVIHLPIVAGTALTTAIIPDLPPILGVR